MGGNAGNPASGRGAEGKQCHLHHLLLVPHAAFQTTRVNREKEAMEERLQKEQCFPNEGGSSVNAPM